MLAAPVRDTHRGPRLAPARRPRCRPLRSGQRAARAGGRSLRRAGAAAAQRPGHRSPPRPHRARHATAPGCRADERVGTRAGLAPPSWSAAERCWVYTGRPGRSTSPRPRRAARVRRPRSVATPPTVPGRRPVPSRDRRLGCRRCPDHRGAALPDPTAHPAGPRTPRQARGSVARRFGPGVCGRSGAHLRRRGLGAGAGPLRGVHCLGRSFRWADASASGPAAAARPDHQRAGRYLLRAGPRPRCRRGLHRLGRGPPLGTVSAAPGTHRARCRRRSTGCPVDAARGAAAVGRAARDGVAGPGRGRWPRACAVGPCDGGPQP